MKKILRMFWIFFEAMGQARAAAVLTRAGEIEMAKNLYKN
jgi:hypothetical protein